MVQATERLLNEILSLSDESFLTKYLLFPKTLRGTKRKLRILNELMSQDSARNDSVLENNTESSDGALSSRLSGIDFSDSIDNTVSVGSEDVVYEEHAHTSSNEWEIEISPMKESDDLQPEEAVNPEIPGQFLKTLLPACQERSPDDLQHLRTSAAGLSVQSPKGASFEAHKDYDEFLRCLSSMDERPASRDLQ